MNVQRWLQVHVVALCVLGASFVTLSTENWLIPLSVLAAGITSVFFTDVYKWFQLNRLLGNLAAVIAVVVSLGGFFAQVESRSQLLAISSLLVYLQMILFFQEKNPRLYWQIMLLSLLQVVVGAALHLGSAFGVLLLFYTAISISTLVLFFIHRETEAHSALLEGPAMGEVSSSLKAQEAGPIKVRIGGNRADLRQGFVSGALVRQIAFLTLGALLFAGVFFYSAPRHSQAAWSASRGLTQAQTGFSREVELQQMGEMLQDNSVVMRVRLKDAKGQSIHPLDPYFAGEVLVHYRNDEERHASWLSARRDGFSSRQAMRPPEAPLNSTVAEIDMLRAAHPSLFAIPPVYGYQTPNEIRLDPYSRLLFRQGNPDDYFFEQLDFTVATTGIVDGQQAQIVPDTRPMPRHESDRHQWQRRLLEEELENCLRWTSWEDSQFPGTKALAKSILKEQGVPSDDPIRAARTLEEHFLTPGLYKYSLNLNVPRDQSLDPIEDFVLNHRTGHCQYFASALVIMLRSQGLPARMVVGYRGSEFNEVGGFYQVRQRNAHAWVEMHLRPDQIPLYETTGGQVGEAGAWMRLDPTPPSDEEVNAFAQNWIGTARDWLDYADIIWSDYVVGLNRQRQRETLYGAFESGDDPEKQDLHFQIWQERLKTLAGWLGIHINLDGNSWGIAFDWRAALTVMALSLVLVGLWRLMVWLWPRLGLPNLLAQARSRRKATIPFYARLEELLAKRGRSRRPAETPQEYVDNAIRDLAISHGDGLRSTVRAFYQVRFGEIPLNPAELELIDRTLAELERTSPLTARTTR